MDDAFARLAATIRARRGADPAGSYVASLLAAGPPRLARKVGEEAAEVMVAALAEPATLVAEAADLVFHLAVLLEAAGHGLGDVAAELARREGVGGHAEKAARPA